MTSKVRVFVVCVVVAAISFSNPLIGRPRADTPVAPGILLVGAIALGFAVGKEIFDDEAEVELGLGSLAAGPPQGARVKPQETVRAPLTKIAPGLAVVDFSRDLGSLEQRGVTAAGRFTRLAIGPFAAITIESGKFGGDLFRWRAATKNESLGYRTVISGSESFTKESNATVDDSKLVIHVNYFGSLLTTPMRKTDAAASVFLRISSPELGGLFEGSAGIREDAGRPILLGDMAKARHVMLTDGQADIQFESDALVFDIPKNLKEFSIDYEVSFVGVAVPM